MARIARVIIPGIPHHVVQRGNRRLQTFFSEEDYLAYIAFMASSCKSFDVEVWAYCLMPNHVHLIMVPTEENKLRLAVGQAHQSYTRYVNNVHGWKGHLWQGRFFSTPLDSEHMISAVRYVEQNPVRAGLVSSPFEYKWSSALAHLKRENDNFCVVAPLIAQIDNWPIFLNTSTSEDSLNTIRKAITSGRPVGGRKFIEQLEKITGRNFFFKKPGRPCRNFEP